MRERDVGAVDRDGHGDAPSVHLLQRARLVQLVKLVEVFVEWFERHLLPVRSHQVLPRALGLQALQFRAILLAHVVQVRRVALHAVLRPAEVLARRINALHEVRVEPAVVHEVWIELIVKLVVRVSVPVRFVTAAVVEIWTWSKAKKRRKRKPKKKKTSAEGTKDGKVSIRVNYVKAKHPLGGKLKSWINSTRSSPINRLLIVWRASDGGGKCKM